MMHENYHSNSVTHTVESNSIPSHDDKRFGDRIIVRLKAVMISQGMSYVGMIENISEYGFYMLAIPTKHAVDFTPGSAHIMKLRDASVDTINVNCRLKWSYKTPPFGLTLSLGMEILDPSPEFRMFLETLR